MIIFGIELVSLRYVQLTTSAGFFYKRSISGSETGGCKNLRHRSLPADLTIAYDNLVEVVLL